MILELLKAFLFIFIAEMGDKTQILAMAFATKYKLRQVIIGIMIGSFLNHALAVLLGANLQHFIPIETLSIIAGFSFVVFGIWSLRFEDEEEESKSEKYGPIMTVSIAFFIGELGDKTQLTAIALSTDAQFPFFILLGTVSGMVVTGLIGIFVGIKLGSKIDDFYIKVSAACIFLTFGYLKLYSNLPTTFLSPIYIIIFTILVIAIILYLLIPTLQKRKQKRLSNYRRIAQKLQDYFSNMYEQVNDICLGVNHCGKCSGNECLVGYTKHILTSAKKGLEYDTSYVTDNILDKEFDRGKVLTSYLDTITF